MTAIALLGWGSLIWDARPEFDQWHDPSRTGGPVLKLEFSRISASRDGALTLAIDPVFGAGNSVCHAGSRRTALADAVADLLLREGTIVANIGCLGPDPRHRRCRDPESGEAIAAWAGRIGIDAVAWTDLPGNFEERIGRAFSVGAAVDYLRGLDAAGKAQAVAYIANAPASIETPLRRALAAETWFAAAACAQGLKVPSPV
jgi:hypothetical protein